MMNALDTEKILELISEFADEQFQLRSWFGIGPEATSHDEMCNQIFDLDPSSWIEFNSRKMGPFLEKYLRDFFTDIQRLPDYSDPWAAFSSMEWIALRLKASVIRELLIKNMT